MFARVLYVDPDRVLELRWFGLGALQVRTKMGVRRAHPVQKRALYTLVGKFEALGQPVSPSNPRCSRLMREFAELLEQPPTSLAWRAFFSSDPDETAAHYAGRGDT
jgi:hypothetical protein